MSKAEGKRAALIGAGRMGSAMAHGWLRSLRDAGLKSLDIVEPMPSADVQELAQAGKARLNASPEQVDVVVLAVKPQAFAKTAPGIAGWIGPDTLIVSIMAGITITRLAKTLKATRIGRAMPNTPGAVGAGVTGYALSAGCGEADARATTKLLAPLGLVVGPLDEGQMDAVTAVSGSGPAYVFLLAETLAAAGREAGLDEATAKTLARETVIGAGKLLAGGGDPADLRKAVTSPNGTTAAALDVLMAKGAMPDVMREAVAAAKRRGAELSKEG